MSITIDQVETIPAVYRTFLEALWPVIRSHEDGSVIRVSGIPYWMIASRVADRHGLPDSQIQELSNRLQENGWIEVDRLGFYTPKGKGIEVLRAMFQPEHLSKVPDLPQF